MYLNLNIDLHELSFGKIIWLPEILLSLSLKKGFEVKIRGLFKSL
jgi:hypothetical protein